MTQIQYLILMVDMEAHIVQTLLTTPTDDMGVLTAPIVQRTHTQQGALLLRGDEIKCVENFNSPHITFY